MHLNRLLSECSAGASLHPGELGPPKTVGRRGGGCTPQHGTAAPAKHREQQKRTTYPLPCFPHGGLSKCKLPTPRRYLPHAGTYFIKEAAKCWPNRKLSPANDAQLPPDSAGLQKANPFLPQPAPCGDTRVVLLLTAAPEEVTPNPTPAFPAPEGKQNHPCDDLPRESLAHTTKMLREPCAWLR